METEDSIYFYREKDNFGYLSNFYKSKFIENGVEYCCMEKYIMKKKQEYFEPNNHNLAYNIMNEKSPSQIKKYGRLVKNFNNTIWERERINVAYNGILAKFSQNTNLKNLLLSTGNKNIYEATRNDKIWAIGFNVNEALNINPNLYGENLLGVTLMNVRDKLLE